MTQNHFEPLLGIKEMLQLYVKNQGKCPTNVDVSGFDHWVTLAGYSKTKDIPRFRYSGKNLP